MFPVSDFNFVVAGIATFAATVGYACSRRLSASLYVSSNPSSVRKAYIEDIDLSQMPLSFDKLLRMKENHYLPKRRLLRFLPMISLSMKSRLLRTPQ